jgi:hypothetical protein
VKLLLVSIESETSLALPLLVPTEGLVPKVLLIVDPVPSVTLKECDADRNIDLEIVILQGVVCWVQSLEVS